MNRREFINSALAAVCADAVFSRRTEAADNYPSKPIKIVVAYASGTVLDVWARRVADRLSKAVGQQVIVENKPGASGTIGATSVANASPDGYSLLYGGATELALAPSLFPNLPYENEKRFEPITRFTSGSAILVANPNLPVTSIQELIVYARSHPGVLKGGSPGTGTLVHLLLLALNHVAGIEVLHVPYKSGMQALTDVMAGHIDIMFDWTTSSRGFITAGKLRPLVIAGSERKPFIPQVPAATEFGWKDLDFWGWNAFMAPAKTPKHIVGFLHKTLLPILHSKDFEAEVALGAAEIVTTTPEELALFIAHEQKRYKELVRLTGVKLE